MGKKASLKDILAKGKAALEADEPQASASVPLKSKLPNGLTIKEFMKQNGVTREEATSIYCACMKAEAAERKKIKLHGPSHAPEDEKPEKPSSSKKRTPESNKAESGKRAKVGDENLGVVPYVEPKPVKRVLFADEVENTTTPLTRASKKRPPSDEEAKIHRSNANPEISTPPDTPARAGILKRGWLLGFACRYCLLQLCIWLVFRARYWGMKLPSA